MVVFNYVRCLEVGAEDLNVVTIVAASTVFRAIPYKPCRVLEYLFDLSVGELPVMRPLEPHYVLRLKFVCSGEKDDDEEHASYGMVQCFIHHLLKLRLNMQMESGLCPEIY